MMTLTTWSLTNMDMNDCWLESRTIQTEISDYLKIISVIIVYKVKYCIIIVYNNPILYHRAGAVVQRQLAGLLVTGSLVRTHSVASFVINFASLSPASAWPSLA